MDRDILGEEGTHEDPVFRFFDWKNPIWTQIQGEIVRQKRKQHHDAWYTHEFTFTIGEDIAGVDYFGLRLKKGMFGISDQDDGAWVICEECEQQMIFDTPYFILNPKDPLHEVIQIRQDIWMPLLVAAYTLGSAIERRGRPYFSQSIAKIQDWFEFVIGQRQREARTTSWDETAARRQLLSEMIRELWEKGPRRLVAFYSGMGYVFNALRLEDMGADAIHDFYTGFDPAKGTAKGDRADDVSPRLFAIMLLLGLRTEKARLYVTIDLSEQQPRESYTRNGIRELLETKNLMALFFAYDGQQYAPIRIPRAFELEWGHVAGQKDAPGGLRLEVRYKRDMPLMLAFTMSGEEGRYSISLMKRHDGGRQEWLGKIILHRNKDTGDVDFISESITSNFRHLRDINAFKYILLIAAIQYVVHGLHTQPRQIVFEADFFDHCAPYDLMLLQNFGWEPSTYNIADYNLPAAEVFPYSGRAMTLPVARIPSRKKTQPALVVYLLGQDVATVAVDKAVYENFVARVHLWNGWHIKMKKQVGILIDGVPYRLASEQTFRRSFDDAFPHIQEWPA